MTCGTGGWSGPKPGDPDNNVLLSATPVFGGVSVSWTFPITYPHAVAHVLVYRGTSLNYASSLKIATVNSSQFFDSNEGTTEIQYYYWIQIVSVNGTVGYAVGPATALSRPSIATVIEQLTGKIEDGALSHDLKTQIDQIAVLNQGLTDEETRRIAANAALGEVIAGIQLDTEAAISNLLDGVLEQTNALLQESLDRANADLAEANSRVEAVTLESIARVGQVQDAAYAALEATLAANGINTAVRGDIALARSELSSDLQAGLSAEAKLRTTLATKLDTDIGTTLGVIADEALARSDGDSAEATARNTLSTKILGVDGTSLTQGLLYQERVTRVAQDSALSQQITLLSAGAGEQFDWAKIWYFDTSVGSWTGNGTPTALGGWLRPADQASGAYVNSPAGMATDGAKYAQVKLRIRKTGSPTFAGFLYWQSTTDTAWDNSRRVALVEPTYDANGIGLITVTTAWGAITVNKIRVDLSSAQAVGSCFELDWVAVGRPSPGASSAQLLNMQTVQADWNQASTDDYTALHGQVNDPSTGLLKSVADIVLNYSTTSDANEATAAAQTTLTAHFGPRIIFRQATAPTQVTNHTAVVLADGSTTYLPKLAIGSAWFDTDDGNKPFTWDGGAWVYTPDMSATANDAFVDRLDTAFADPMNATTSSIMDAVSLVTDPVTGLVVTQAGILSNQSTQAGINEAVARDSKRLIAQSQQTDEAVLRSLLINEISRDAFVGSIALAREELTSRIVAGESAEAQKRLELLAVVDDNHALLTSQYRTAANQDVATASAISSLVTTVGNHTAAISNEQTARSDGDTVLTNSISTLTGKVDNNAAAIVLTNSTLVNTEQALAQSITNLGTTVGDNQSNLVNSYYTKSATDSAISAANLALKTTMEGVGGSVGDLSTTLNNNYYTKTAADSATAAATTALKTTMEGAGGSVGLLGASLTNDYYTKTAADSAISTATTALKTTMEGVGGSVGSLGATLTSQYYTKTATDAVIASSKTQLKSYADFGVKTFTQATAPTKRGVDTTAIPTVDVALVTGDVWVDTDDNVRYQWNGSAWIVASDSSQFNAWVAGTYATDLADIADKKIESWFATSDPSSGWVGTNASHTGDFWYNSTTKLLKRWSGTTWVTVENQIAIDAAAAANAAQDTADGKITTFVATSAPTAQGVGDIWIDTGDQNKMYRWSGSAWVSIRDTQASALITTLEQTKLGYATKGGAVFDNGGTIVDKAGVDTWNAAHPTDLATWHIGLPLATAVKQVTVTDPISGTASLEQAFTAQKGVNDGMKALYTVKVSVPDANGVRTIGGFGVYGDSTGIEAGFDVDRFWVGRSAVSEVTGTVSKVKPFIINGGEVLIDNAVIKNLGASSINTNGLTIRNAAGAVILDSGYTIQSQIAPYTSGADVTSANTAAAVFGQGPFATLSQITSANASTYIANAAIDVTQIKVASIGSLSALTATIGTLRTASSGARMELRDNVIKVFDSAGTLRVQIGDLSL